jgi:hypothetical protein
MTPNPRNESVYAPSRLLMAHIPTHFGRKTRERTQGIDDRTRGIDERTRLARERTRLLRSNPRGQDDAGAVVWSFWRSMLRWWDAVELELGRKPSRVGQGRLPIDPEARLDGRPSFGYYSYHSVPPATQRCGLPSAVTVGVVPMRWWSGRVCQGVTLAVSGSTASQA